MEDYVTITTNSEGKQIVEIHTDKKLSIPKKFVFKGKMLLASELIKGL